MGDNYVSIYTGQFAGIESFDVLGARVMTPKVYVVNPGGATPVTRTPAAAVVTTSGTVAAGKKAVAFSAGTGFSGTVAGAGIPAGAGISFDAGATDTLGTIAYVVTTGSLTIATLT